MQPSFVDVCSRTGVYKRGHDTDHGNLYQLVVEHLVDTICTYVSALQKMIPTRVKFVYAYVYARWFFRCRMLRQERTHMSIIAGIIDELNAVSRHARRVEYTKLHCAMQAGDRAFVYHFYIHMPFTRVRLVYRRQKPTDLRDLRDLRELRDPGGARGSTDPDTLACWRCTCLLARASFAVWPHMVARTTDLATFVFCDSLFA